MIEKIKQNYKKIIMVLLVISMLCIPYFASLAKYNKVYDVASIDLKIKAPQKDNSDALTPHLDNTQITDNDLTVEYAGNNTYVLNGASTPNIYSYIRLNNKLEIIKGNVDVRPQIMQYYDDILDAGDTYDFSVEILSGTVKNLVNSSQFTVAFRTNENNSGAALTAPKYNFYTKAGNVQNAVTPVSINVANLFIGGNLPLIFDNFTFKINLRKVDDGENDGASLLSLYDEPDMAKISNDTTIQLGTNATLSKNNDGSFVLNGKTDSKTYLRISSNDIINVKSLNMLYDEALAKETLFDAGDNVNIEYIYKSGTVTRNDSKNISIYFADTSEQVNEIPFPLFTTAEKSPDESKFSLYESTQKNAVLNSNASQLVMYIDNNIEFDNYCFYINYSKIDKVETITEEQENKIETPVNEETVVIQEPSNEEVQEIETIEEVEENMLEDDLNKLQEEKIEGQDCIEETDSTEDKEIDYESNQE